MPLINTSVPNLIQGVSQQPDATRFAGQGEEQENALSSVADGLKKRPNTRHISRLLTSAIDSDSFVHFINRSDTEKYVVIHDGTKLQAWNMVTGNESSIQVGDNIYKASFTSSEITAHNANDADGNPINTTTYVASSYTPASDTYLNTSNARENLKGVTVADNTFLLNTTKAVEEDTADKSDPVNKDAFVFVKQGDYAKNYAIIFNENQTAEITYTPVMVAGMAGGTRLFQNNFVITNGGSGYTPNSEISWISGGAYNIRLVTNVSGVVTGFKYNNSSYTGTLTFVTPFAPAFPYGVTGVPAPTGSGSNVAIGTVSKLTDKATANSSDGRGARSTAIITDLFNEADGNTTLKAYFDLDSKGNGLRFTLKSTATSEDFFIRTEDDLSGSGLGLIYKEVASIADLPLNAPNNFKTKIIGDAEIDQDNYYVKFRTGNGSDWSEGSWEETVGFNVTQSFKASSMPHTLINDGLDSFKLEEVLWDSRTVGDEETNPMPSFVFKTINNMGVFKDRLVLLSGDNVIFSEAGHFFNFFRNTTTTLLDSAPIDVAVNSKFVTNLKSAVGFQENLILFSENAQFALKGGDLLTPNTVSVNPITNFDFTTKIDPLPLGSYIYYPFTRGAFTGLREFTVNATTDNYDSTEVTEHIPSYIPSNIIDMTGTSTEDMIALLSGDEKGSLYIYNYFWSNNQKVLSAWSKFTFTGEIRGIEFIESTLYMVTTDDQSNTHLVALAMETDAAEVDHNGNTAPFRTLLDRRVRAKMTSGSDLIEFEQADGTYSSANADLPYVFFNGTLTGSETLDEVFVDSTGVTHTLKPINTNGVRVHLTGSDASSTLYGYVGLPYTMKYRFSTQVFKAQSGNSASPTNASAMQVRNGTMFFDDTHTFDVKVTPENRTTAISTFLADDLPEAEEIIVEEYPNIATPDFNSEGVVFSRTNEQTFTIVASNSTATKYIEFANSSNGMVAGKHRITFDADFLTGSPSNILLSYADVDGDPSGHAYGSASIKEGSNVIEIDVFDDNTLIAGGTNPNPKIYWRINSGSTLNLSVTNFKIERISPIKFAEGNFRFPVYSKAKHANILIQNDSPFDSKFSSAEFESFVHPRSSRYG